MKTLKKTQRTTLKRLPKRGSHERDLINAFIDEALICHVGFVIDGKPFVIPTAIMRKGDFVYLHGNKLSRMLKHLGAGGEACITITHIDGLVLARSGFHHSMNYRSVTLFGRGERVTGDDKTALLDAFVESLVPGRTADIRPMTRKEVNATGLVRFAVEEASAKVRSGPPVDDREDYALGMWAGELPLGLAVGKPVNDPLLAHGIEPPAYVKRYSRG